MEICKCIWTTYLIFVLMTVFKQLKTAPIFDSAPLWSGDSPYLYHPSIRWIQRPPIFYIWPVVAPPTESNSASPLPNDRAEDRLFPSYSKQNSTKSRNVFFEKVNQPNMAEHRDLAETVNEMELDDIKPEQNSSDSENVTGISERVKRQVLFPESSDQSKNVKFTFDDLLMLESAFNHPVPSPPELNPFPHPTPIFQPFIYPGPSALYPQMFPLGVNGQNYYPTSPYRALSVDSLLIPLVGMVGLNLLAPDIVKTKRGGKPSDLNGLDVFKRISDDRECLKHLACEFGVVFNENDDPAAIKRVLERAWAAKRSVPLHHYENRERPQNCGSHNCEVDLGSPYTISALLGRQSSQLQRNSSTTINATEFSP